MIKGESKVVYEWQGTILLLSNTRQPQSENSLEFVVANSAASGSLSAKAKKVQGARVGARTGAGAIKLAEEMGEAREQARAI